MPQAHRMRLVARKPAHQATHPAPHPAGELRLGTVQTAAPCLVAIGTDQPVPAAVATHVTALQPGQQVVVMNVGADQWLVLAAMPLPGNAPPFSFDPATGTLRIDAPRLQLCALGTIELRCGDAVVALSMDGRVELRGQDILSSATGAHRIEGASIDLN